MKNIILLLFILFWLSSCNSTPKNFTLHSQITNTNLHHLIPIEGIYISEHACDSNFFSIFRFYQDGRFKLATTTIINSELLMCFADKGKEKVCNYIQEGRYELKKDTIKTQTILNIGSGCVIFRDYLIFPDKSIKNISDYVQPEHTNLAYMKNYPSFYENPCSKKAKFQPFSYSSF